MAMVLDLLYVTERHSATANSKMMPISITWIATLSGEPRFTEHWTRISAERCLSLPSCCIDSANEAKATAGAVAFDGF
jgi:hypothetical protein